MEKPKWRGVAKIRMHVAIRFSCILAIAIVAHKIGRLELANNIAVHILKRTKKLQKPNKQKTN